MRGEAPVLWARAAPEQCGVQSTLQGTTPPPESTERLHFSVLIPGSMPRAAQLERTNWAPKALPTPGASTHHFPPFRLFKCALQTFAQSSAVDDGTLGPQSPALETMLSLLTLWYAVQATVTISTHVLQGGKYTVLPLPEPRRGFPMNPTHLCPLQA